MRGAQHVAVFCEGFLGGSWRGGLNIGANAGEYILAWGRFARRRRGFTRCPLTWRGRGPCRDELCEGRGPLPVFKGTMFGLAVGVAELAGDGNNAARSGPRCGRLHGGRDFRPCDNGARHLLLRPLFATVRRKIPILDVLHIRPCVEGGDVFRIARLPIVFFVVRVVRHLVESPQARPRNVLVSACLRSPLAQCCYR